MLSIRVKWYNFALIEIKYLLNHSLVILNFKLCTEHCQLMRNFNSMFALLSGLGHGSVSRLRQTWEKLPAKYLKFFEVRFDWQILNYNELNGVLLNLWSKIRRQTTLMLKFCLKNIFGKLLLSVTNYDSFILFHIFYKRLQICFHALFHSFVSWLFIHLPSSGKAI